MRVLVVHNRYRVEGGEERSVDLQLRALAAAGIDHDLYERRSTEVGKAAAAAALLRGGDDPADLAAAARGADVVHVHNMQPLIGPRGLEAAREAGARVVLHLHNLRLFCAIGVASRDGGPCFRCHHRLTLPGAVLNCRGSVPESVAYATALSLHQPRVLDAVDRFVVPSRYAARQAALLGVPADRIAVVEHYLPADAFAERSRAAEGAYALVASRLSVEKGIDAAIETCLRAGVPLKIAGEGPQEDRLRTLATAGPSGAGATAVSSEGVFPTAASSRAGTAPAASEEALAPVPREPVEFLGRVERERVAELLAGAAFVLMPSRYHEFSPYSALEAAAAGVPVVATRMGGLPELLGAERCVEPGDQAALEARIRVLWTDPEERARKGEALLQRARATYAQSRFTTELVALYEQLRSIRPAA